MKSYAKKRNVKAIKRKKTHSLGKTSLGGRLYRAKHWGNRNWKINEVVDGNATDVVPKHSENEKKAIIPVVTKPPKLPKRFKILSSWTLITVKDPKKVRKNNITQISTEVEYDVGQNLLLSGKKKLGEEKK